MKRIPQNLPLAYALRSCLNVTSVPRMQGRKLAELLSIASTWQRDLEQFPPFLATEGILGTTIKRGVSIISA